MVPKRYFPDTYKEAPPRKTNKKLLSNNKNIYIQTSGNPRDFVRVRCTPSEVEVHSPNFKSLRP